MAVLGSVVDIYGAHGQLTSSNISSVYDSREFILSTNMMIPYVTGSATSLGGNKMLFDNGIINQQTALLFDTRCLGWQVQTPITYGQTDITFVFNIDLILSQFPALIDINDYVRSYDVIMVSPHDDQDVCYIWGVSSVGSTNFWVYRRSTDEYLSPNLLSILKFGTNNLNVGQGEFIANQFLVLMYDAANNTFARYDPSGAAYSYRRNGNYGQYNTVYTFPRSEDLNFYDTFKLDYVPVEPSTDPYSNGGESDTGGGTGTFDGTSVDVDFATLPTLSAVDTGFITIYNPSLAQLQALATYMWSGLFDIDTFKKLFADPMQAILGLSIVPGPVPNGGSQTVKVGNISTGVTMTKAATQYIDIDCGTLNVEEFWGAYLDYEPYTKAEIYLPFIGVHQIAVDDIMNKAVHIKYHIDLLSGGCACEIKCGGSVLYTFIGSCAVSIPVTGSDWTNLINGVLSAASAIGTMVATGGATAPAAAGEIASAAVNSLKPSIEKSGSIAGAGGLLAGKVPVLILTRPRQALPGKQNTFTGYPAFITRSLGAISGYTEVHSIRLSGIDGTESEIDEIEELLKGGVIL